MKGLLAVISLLLAVACGARFYPEFTHPVHPEDVNWVAAETQPRLQPTLRYHLALSHTPEQLAHLKEFFDAVSDPTNEKYGQYATKDQMTRMMTPPASRVSPVRRFLESHGLRHEMVEGDYIRFYGTPEQINRAFQTEVILFEHKVSKARVWRSVQPYSLPSNLKNAVDFVSGIHHFPSPKKAPLFAQDAPMIGPNDLRTRYNVTDFANPAFNSTQAVAEFQGQYYSPSDLVQFFQQYQPGNYSSTVSGVIGPNSPGDPGVEAELDIQYIMGVNPNAKTYFYSQSSFQFWDDLVAWIAILNSDPRPPYVHSISYGEQAEHQTSVSYKKNFDVQMQKLGSRGLTIIFASGDSGTGCSLCYRYDPSFPATTPSLTCVGATQFDQSSPPYTSESAVSQFGSGGGFSWTFDRPKYQDQAVLGYFNTSHLPASFHWHKPGRGTPDVAALGIGFSVVVSGGVESIGGTSASAPTFSAIVALLNEQQIKRGKPVLGFLNPWLYQTWAKSRSAFYDVTNGGNADGCCIHGFVCEKGWDAVTGLGTPNYAVLKQLLP